MEKNRNKKKGGKLSFHALIPCKVKNKYIGEVIFLLNQMIQLYIRDFLQLCHSILGNLNKIVF